jgi:hypothetical protein
VVVIRQIYSVCREKEIEFLAKFKVFVAEGHSMQIKKVYNKVYIVKLRVQQWLILGRFTVWCNRG